MRLDHLLSKEKENDLDGSIVYFSMYFISTLYLWYGAVAQLARAPALQAGGQEFDSPQLHHANLQILLISYKIKNKS